MDREDELIFQYAKQVLDLETEIWKKNYFLSLNIQTREN